MRTQPDLIAVIRTASKLDAAQDAAAAAVAAADADHIWVLERVLWSYDGAPTGGGLTIVAGSTTLIDLDITAAGPGQLDLDGIHNDTKNEAVTATLAAGGGTVVGKITLIYR